MASYDKRNRNFYGHEAMDLKAREEMQRRGVRPDANLPSADYTFEGAAETLVKGKEIRERLEQLRTLADRLYPSMNRKRKK